MRNIQTKGIKITLLFALILCILLPIETNAASKLKLSNKQLTIYVGPGCGTKTITVKGAPEGAKVKWKTSNKNVATVKNGVITPKKVGKATITATVNKKKLNCKVTVKEPKTYIMSKENAKCNTALITGDGGEKIETSWLEWKVGTDIPEGQYKVLKEYEGKYTTFEETPFYMGSTLCEIIYGKARYSKEGVLMADDVLVGNLNNKNFDLIEVKKGDVIKGNIYCKVMFIPIKYVNSFQKYDVKDKVYDGIWSGGIGQSIYKVGRDIPEGRYVLFFENSYAYEEEVDTATSVLKRIKKNTKKNWTPDIAISNSLHEVRCSIVGTNLDLGYSKKEYKILKETGKAKMISFLGDMDELIKKGAYFSKTSEAPETVGDYAYVDVEVGVPITLKEAQWIYSNYFASGILPEPTKFTLNAESKTLKKGKSFQLKVKKVEPKGAFDKVTYSSSNKKVATVDKTGKVAAKKPGTAIITVQCPVNKKIKATCVVTVVSDKKPTATPTPTKKPTAPPTKQPTVEPSVIPTVELGITPTVGATVTPTTAPSVTPVEEPSATPTTVPDEITPTDTDITPTPESSEVLLDETDITVEPETGSEPINEPDVTQQGEENVMPTVEPV